MVVSHKFFHWIWNQADYETFDDTSTFRTKHFKKRRVSQHKVSRSNLLVDFTNKFVKASFFCYFWEAGDARGSYHSHNVVDCVHLFFKFLLSMPQNEKILLFLWHLSNYGWVCLFFFVSQFLFSLTRSFFFSFKIKRWNQRRWWTRFCFWTNCLQFLKTSDLVLYFYRRNPRINSHMVLWKLSTGILKRIQ